MSTRHLSPLLCSLGLATASVLLASCSGSGSKAPAAQADEQQLVRFARCLREHGVNVSTPKGPGSGIRASGIDPHTMEAAQRACKRYQPRGRFANLSPQQRVAREEAVQRFAKCMREHGIKVEASTAGGGGLIKIQAGRASSGPNPQSPAFEAAQKACQALLPKPPGGARGAGPSTERAGPGGADRGPAVGFQVGG